MARARNEDIFGPVRVARPRLVEEPVDELIPGIDVTAGPEESFARPQPVEPALALELPTEPGVLSESMRTRLPGVVSATQVRRPSVVSTAPSEEPSLAPAPTVTPPRPPRVSRVPPLQPEREQPEPPQAPPPAPPGVMAEEPAFTGTGDIRGDFMAALGRHGATPAGVRASVSELQGTYPGLGFLDHPAGKIDKIRLPDGTIVDVLVAATPTGSAGPAWMVESGPGMAGFGGAGGGGDIGPAPSGFDPGKWADLSHQTPKYQVGRLLGANPARGFAGFEDDLAAMGITIVDDDEIRLPDGTLVDVIRGGGGLQWHIDQGGAGGGGGGLTSPMTTQSGLIPGGPGVFSGPLQQVGEDPLSAAITGALLALMGGTGTGVRIPTAMTPGGVDLPTIVRPPAIDNSAFEALSRAAGVRRPRVV